MSKTDIKVTLRDSIVIWDVNVLVPSDLQVLSVVFTISRKSWITCIKLFTYGGYAHKL